ncbi:hypothetical protein JOF53_000603 [Crossiella equi]|uniref:Uncharacterized protein n=1 Tax=Crossiella equi TaxID=130796 RepID=A0ABS5A598_9PSEU|nr:hypothetical protein [Crossiella equi]MBP2471731.1 hypothetical protein [Crossiella equi]
MSTSAARPISGVTSPSTPRSAGSASPRRSAAAIVALTSPESGWITAQRVEVASGALL